MNTFTITRPEQRNVHFDWSQVARLMLTSRAMDALEETELYPQKKINYQFSARGHDLSQVLLGSLLTHPHDAAGAYYRSRPFPARARRSPAPRGRYRPKPEVIYEPLRARRRRHGSRRSSRLDQGSGWPGPFRSRPRLAATDGSAFERPFRAGYASLQEPGV